MSPKLQKLQDAFRAEIPFLEEDAYMSPLLEIARDFIALNSPEDLLHAVN